ncbi:hypothetical protein ACPB9E_30635 [Streptomyces exfoliatus]|uniref:hypothetical protein n=1 Tax=Streptomyces exfoliatus TaxID=1905 RepID=UPI003C2E4E83
MTESARPSNGAKPVSEWRNVYDFRGGSLLELQAILYGYRVVSEIYGPEAVMDFEHQGPFAEWLWPRLGRNYSSPLGWAVEITKAAEASGKPAVDLFFDLLDEFKDERGTEAR